MTGSNILSVAGGAGGEISITNAGNLLVNPGNIDIAPTQSTGGQLNLASANGTLLVNGSLSANAAISTDIAGDITLSSGSATAFVVGGTKLTNGVTGSVTATGIAGAQGGGTITISNTGAITDAVPITAFNFLSETAGGTGIAVNAALGNANAVNINLATTGTGAITATKAPVQVALATAANPGEVDLTTSGGAISVSKLNGDNVSANTNSNTAAVSITSIDAANALNIIGPVAGGKVTIVTPANLTSNATIDGTAITLTSTAKTGTIAIDQAVKGTGLVTISAAGAITATAPIEGDAGIKISNKIAGDALDLSNLTASGKGTISITSAGDINDTGSIECASTVTLAASKGAISTDNVGDVTAPTTLSMTALTSVNLTGSVTAQNSIVAKATSTTAGAGNIQYFGDITATGAKSTITLTASSVGTVSDDNAPSQAISGGTVTVTGPTGISFSTTDLTATTGALTVTAAKGSILEGGAMTSAVKNVVLSALNNISLFGNVSAATTIKATSSASKTAQEINLAGNIAGGSGTTGSITLTVGKLSNIEDGSGLGAFAISAGSVTMTAPAGIDLHVNSQTPTITATAKALTMTSSAGDISISPTTTLNATGTGGTITLTSGAVGSFSSQHGIIFQGSATANGSLTFKASAGDFISNVGASSIISSTNGKLVVTAFNCLESFGTFAGGTGVALSTTNSTVQTAPAPVNVLSATNVTTTNGPITMVSAGENLSLSGGNVSAGSTSGKTKATVLIDDTNVAKNNRTVISINNEIIATGGPGGGNVTVAVGPAPSTGKNPTTIAPGFTIQNLGTTGQVFFGSNPSEIQGSASNLTTQNANIIFNTTATNAIGISSSSITADPPQATAPSMIVSPAAASINIMPSDIASGGIGIGGGAGALTFVGPIGTAQIGAFSPTANAFGGVPATIAQAAMSGLNAAAVGSAQVISVLGWQNGSQSLPAAIGKENVYVLDAPGSDNDGVAGDSDTAVQTTAIYNGSLLQGGVSIGDSGSGKAVRWISETETVGGKIPAALHEGDRPADFANGALLAAPRHDTVYKTEFGDVSVQAKALALIMAYGHGLAVYNLHDQRAGAISVTVDGKKIVLNPGRCVVIAPATASGFEQINPAQLICYGHVAQQKLGFGKQAFIADFSLPSVINAVPALRKIISEEKAELRKISQSFLKTSAILMLAGRGYYSYHQIVKPQLTACNR